MNKVKIDKNDWVTEDDILLYDLLAKTIERLNDSIESMGDYIIKGNFSITVVENIFASDNPSVTFNNKTNAQGIEKSKVILKNGMTIYTGTYEDGDINDVRLKNGNVVLTYKSGRETKTPIFLVDRLNFVSGLTYTQIDISAIKKIFMHNKKNRTLAQCHKLLIDFMNISNETPDINDVLKGSVPWNV